MGQHCINCVNKLFNYSLSLKIIWPENLFYSLEIESKILWGTRLIYRCMERHTTTSQSLTTQPPHSQRTAAQPLCRKNLVATKSWDSAIISAQAISSVSTSCTAVPEHFWISMISKINIREQWNVAPSFKWTSSKVSLTFPINYFSELSIESLDVKLKIWATKLHPLKSFPY